jgi:hypothetical protein
MGTWTKRKKRTRKREVHDAESTNESLKNSWEEEK